MAGFLPYKVDRRSLMRVHANLNEVERRCRASCFEGVKDMAEVGRDNAKQRAPSSKDNPTYTPRIEMESMESLRDSIQVGSTTMQGNKAKSSIFTTKEYASHIEYGTTGPIKPTHGKALGPLPLPLPMFLGSVGGQHAQPFMQPLMWDAMIHSDMRRAFKRTINKNVFMTPYKTV